MTEIILYRNEDFRPNYKTTKQDTKVKLNKFTCMQSYNRDGTSDK